MELKKIGIITSGGDCGGLNGVVKGTAAMANRLGIEAYIIPNGYAGLYNLVDFTELTQLTEERCDRIDISLAGSEAGHSRVKIKNIKSEDKYNRIKEGLKKFKIDALVISGGDDTGSVVVDLLDQGIACIHCPKTMDLDLQTYSVGGDSTINRIATEVNELKTTATTHNRIVALEVFGRYAGHTAFRGGVGGDADAILIPEIPVDFDVLYEDIKVRYMRRILSHDVYSGNYIIVVAEGLKTADGTEIYDETAGVDSFGHKKLAGAGKFVCQQLTKRFKADPEIKKFMEKTHMFVEGLYDVPEVRHVTPGHLVRCGHSSAYDANFGLEAGGAAVQLLKKGITGVTVASVCEGQINYMNTKDAIVQNHVNIEQISMHEDMGICFGRKKEDFKPTFKQIEGKPERYL